MKHFEVNGVWVTGGENEIHDEMVFTSIEFPTIEVKDGVAFVYNNDNVTVAIVPLDSLFFLAIDEGNTTSE